MIYTIEPLGYIESCFPEKFGIPRQSLLAPTAKGRLLLLPPYNVRDCVEGLEMVSHIWLTFVFHQSVQKGWKNKVRSPRLGGKKKQGVLATRSPFRPNHLGLSVVRLDELEVKGQQVILHLAGIDLVEGTPVVDIKPYVPYVDCVEYASNGFAEQPPLLNRVVFLTHVQAFFDTYSCDAYLEKLLTEILQQDPRPAHHAIDEHRLYKMQLFDLDIAWRCREYGDGSREHGKCIEVVDIERIKLK